MQFDLLESLSLAGQPDKPNEDAFAFCARAACVFDGATPLNDPLMPGISDAQWIANFAARRFCAHAQSGEGGIQDWLSGASREAEKSFHALRKRAPRENYEMPCASAILTAVEEQQLQLRWFGDCAALLRIRTGEFRMFGDTLDKREAERDRVEKLSVSSGHNPAQPGVRDEFLPALRVSRNQINTGTEWVFSPDRRCADHAKSAQAEVASGSIVLLASDGFLALISDYGRFSPEQLYTAAQSQGLKKLGQELREIELADACGAIYPRFKASDDATAMLLRLRA